MVICGFCRRECFEDRNWPRNTFRAHHASISTWVASLAERCGICTFLATHLAKALDRISGNKWEQYAFNVDELKAALERLAVVPIYRVRYHPRNIRGQVFLGFEPVHFEDGVTMKSAPQRLPVSLLSRQSFIAYPAPEPIELRTTSSNDKHEASAKPGESAVISLGSSTESDQTTAQMKAWLDNCDHCHPQCQHSKQNPSPDKMPKRLIDVGDPPQPGEPWPPLRLVTSKEVPYTGPYMTLSHCWGPPEHKPLELRTANAAELKVEIKWVQLPNTFRHAIQVVRAMKQRYIWIDSLCIHQGDDGDFNEEGVRMDLIYGRSYCNLAAVHAQNSTYGLFAQRSSDELEPFTASAYWEGYRRDYNIVRSDYWGGKLLSSVLYSRGWVFQERMLSPRIIHFTKQEVLWQCATNAASENFPNRLPTAINYASGEESRLRSLISKLSTREIDIKTRAALNSIWKMSAENYSRLNLTKFTDKVIALSGLVKIISEASDERYYAGLWDFDFVEQLTWSIRGCQNASGAPSKRYPHDDGYVAPSWSWLSMNGLVELRDRAILDRAYQLTILGNGKPQIEPALPGVPFGKLKDAHFKARVMLYSMTFVLDDRSTHAWKALLKDADANIMLYPDEHLCDQDDESKLGVMTITTNAIMLAYTDDIGANDPGKQGFLLAVAPSGAEGQYTRKGLIEFRGLRTDVWRRLEECRIKTQDGEIGYHDAVLR